LEAAGNQQSVEVVVHDVDTLFVFDKLGKQAHFLGMLFEVPVDFDGVIPAFAAQPACPRAIVDDGLNAGKHETGPLECYDIVGPMNQGTNRIRIPSDLASTIECFIIGAPPDFL
jgi:hypothetical protein